MHLANRSSTAYGLANITDNSYFFEALTQIIPYYGAQTAAGLPNPDPIQIYLKSHDSNPFVTSDFQYGYSWDSSELLARRLGSVLNTYWIASLASNAVTGNWDGLNISNQADGGMLACGPVARRETDNITDSPSNVIDQITFSVANTTVFDLGTEQYLYCDRAWLAVLVVSAAVLLCAAVASGIFVFLSVGPDVADFFSALTLAYRVPELSGGSYLDAADRIRPLRNVVIRTGDSNPESDVGNIVVGPCDKVKHLKVGRLYR
jgi:hypothetical protein